MYSRMSLGGFFSKTDSPTLYEKKGKIRWLKCPRHKVAPRKASLQFLSEDISVFIISLKVLLNIPTQTKQKQSWNTAQWKEKLNCASGIHVTQSSFTESFLLLFISGYFFFSILLRTFPNVLSRVPQKEWFQTAQSEEWFNSMRWTHTSQSSCSEIFSPVFNGRHFLAHHRPPGAA